LTQKKTEGLGVKVLAPVIRQVATQDCENRLDNNPVKYTIRLPVIPTVPTDDGPNYFEFCVALKLEMLHENIFLFQPRTV